MKKTEFNLTLDTAGVVYKASGASVEEAILALGLKWHRLKNKGVMTVEKGGAAYEHLFYLKQLKRIFANKETRRMWGKRLELLLTGK